MRGMFCTATLIAIALLPTSLAHADELQSQLLAAAKATRADAYSFRRTLAFERTGAARKVVVEQYDPRRPATDQWTLVSVGGRQPTSKEMAQARKNKRGPVPSYAQLSEWIAAPATRSDPAPGLVLYRYARLPAGTLKLGSHDASADTRAEALVNTHGTTPYVERVRFTSTKGFRMMLVASLQSMVVESRYRQLSDGAAVPASVTSDIQGSMMGKAGQLKSEMTYSDVQRVR